MDSDSPRHKNTPHQKTNNQQGKSNKTPRARNSWMKGQSSPRYTTAANWKTTTTNWIKTSQLFKENKNWFTISQSHTYLHEMQQNKCKQEFNRQIELSRKYKQQAKWSEILTQNKHKKWLIGKSRSRHAAGQAFGGGVVYQSMWRENLRD